MAIRWTMELEDNTARGAESIRSRFRALAKDAENAKAAIDGLHATDSRADPGHAKKLADAYAAYAEAVRDVIGEKQDLLRLNEAEKRQQLEMEGRELHRQAVSLSRADSRKGAKGMLSRFGETVSSPVMAIGDIDGEERDRFAGQGVLSQFDEAEKKMFGITEIAKRMAQMNLLPRGSEMYTVRMAQLAESLTPVAGRLTLATAAATALYAGFDRLVEKGDVGAVRLSNAFSDFATSITKGAGSALTRIQNQVGDIVSSIPGFRQGLGVAADFAEAGNSALRYGSIDGPAEWQREKEQEAERAANKRISDQVAASRRERDATDETQRSRDRQLRTMERKKDVRGIEKKISEDSASATALEESIARAGGATEANLKSNPDIARMKKELDELDATIKQLKNTRFKIIEDAELARAEKAKKLHADFLKHRQDLYVIDQQIAGKNFDANRVISLEDVNKKLAEERRLMEELARTHQTDSVAYNESLKRTNELLTRRSQELARIRDLEREARSFALEVVDMGRSAQSGAMSRELAEKKEAESVDKRRIEMLRSAGAITDQQADEAQRRLASSNAEKETLEKQQKLQRDRLEDAKKLAEYEMKNAKTESEHTAAQNRWFAIQKQQVAQMYEQKEAMAQVDANIARSVREQARAEEDRAAAIQLSAIQKANEQRQSMIGGPGGLLEQMKRNIPSQAVMAEQIKRTAAQRAVAEQKRLGRNLTGREKNDILKKTRVDLMRQAKGPSEAQLRRDQGRMVRDARERARADARRAGKSPRETRELEMQAVREQNRMIAQRQGDGTYRGLAQQNAQRPFQQGQDQAQAALQRQVANSVSMDAMSRQVVNQVLDAQQAALNAWQRIEQDVQQLQERTGIMLQENTRTRTRRAGGN